MAIPSMVSIPHRYAENGILCGLKFQRRPVSIPHRYAENSTLYRFKNEILNMFQSLIGMLKTKRIKHKELPEELFQSLIGMLKTMES